ncbi:MAG: hypothetical protein WAM53_18050, partial [Terrimicrobiaceae bacterium]
GMCEVFLRMIKMFYDDRGFEVFMTPQPPRQIERAVNNLVAGNTKLGWRLRCMVWFFYLLCAVQRFFPIVPRIKLASTAMDAALTAKGSVSKPEMAAVDE